MPLANGTTLIRANDDEIPVLQSIAQAAVELGSFALSRDTSELSYFDSKEAYKEHRGGLRDAGESTIKIEFDRGDRHHEKMLADFNSDDATRVYGFRWTDSGKTEMTSKAIVTSFEITHESGEWVYATATIKWSGAPTWGVWS